MNAAEIQNGQVVRVIKGTVEWATDNLGGTWVDCDDLKPGSGWTYVDGQFRYPQPYQLWLWEDGEWVAPVPMPEPVDGFAWVWNDESGDWQQVEVVEPPVV